MNINTINRGFTLVELLVVIAIISLLSSVVLSSLYTARTRAVTSKFESEMQNLRKAIISYRLDHNDSLPPCPSPLSSGASILTCYDMSAFQFYEDAMKPLVDGKYIETIPHFGKWPNLSSNPSAWGIITYRPSAYNQPGNTEWMCSPQDYATWEIGTHPGIFIIRTNQKLSLTKGYYQCDEGYQCAQSSLVDTYCLELEY